MAEVGLSCLKCNGKVEVEVKGKFSTDLLLDLFRKTHRASHPQCSGGTQDFEYNFPGSERKIKPVDAADVLFRDKLGKT